MPKQIDQYKKAKFILHDRDQGDVKDGWTPQDRYLLEIVDVDGKDRGIVGNDVEVLVQTAKASVDLRRMGPTKKQAMRVDKLRFIFGNPGVLPPLPIHWSYNIDQFGFLTANSPDHQLWLVGTDGIFYGVERGGESFYETGEVNVY